MIIEYIKREVITYDDENEAKNKYNEICDMDNMIEVDIGKVGDYFRVTYGLLIK